MNRAFKIFIVQVLLCMIAAISYAQYDVIKEDYESGSNNLFLSDYSRIVNGDGENETRFIEPIKNAENEYRLGFKFFDGEFNKTVAVDFRAKVVDDRSYFQFDTRQNKSYKKTLAVWFKNTTVIRKWRYYRIVIDFTAQKVRVYSSESGFEAVGEMSDAEYTVEFSNTTGFNMFRFINCKIDDVAVYCGGSVPYVENAGLKKYGARLKALYTYADNESDAEGRTKITWERSDNGRDFSQIYGENEKCLVLNRFDLNKYIRAKIVPYSTAYPEKGDGYYTDAVFIDSVNDYELKNSKGEEVCNISDDDIYSFSAALKNKQTFSAIVAIYNAQGKLCRLYQKTGAEIYIDNINPVKAGQGCYHKVFFFENYRSLKPILDEYDENTSLYKAVLDDINLSEGERKLYDSGNYKGAIKEYRGRFFKNISDGESLPTSAISGNIAIAEDLCENNNIVITNDSAQRIKIHMGNEGAYNWIQPDITYVKYGARMDWMTNLVYAYRQTGDEKYLKKWIAIWRDFDGNFYQQYEKYIKENGTNIGGINVGKMAVGQLDVGMRQYERIKGLAAMGAKDFIDDVTFAEMLYSQSRDSSGISLDTNTPNQFLYGYTSLLETAGIFDSIRISQRLKEYENAMAVFVDENYNADGGETEMSLHYNYDMFTFYSTIKSVYEGKDSAPDWYKKLDDIVKNKLKMLAAVITPTRHNPSLAHDYITEDAFARITASMDKVGKDETVETIINKLSGKSTVAPMFTSVAFPYSGYYIMRSGWESNSDYMFFMGSRFGRGHVEMNKLAVAYSAFGEDLLQSSPSSYSSEGVFTPYDRFLESSFGNNTMVVDGYSQRRLIGAYNDFSEPEKSLWHTSDTLDYVEGTYSGGYNTYQGMWDERKTAAVEDVLHKRQVITDKQNHIAVVCDSMLTEGEHSYIQNWNFAKKFNSRDMVDQRGDAVLSNDAVSGAGIELYSFSPSQLNYSIKCGDKTGEYYKGWFLDSYGTAYTPCVHSEIEFTGAGNQQITTFIVPKENADTRVKSIEKICGGTGFYAVLSDGSKIICLLNCEAASYGTINFSGNMLYIFKSADGKIGGAAIGAKSLSIDGQPVAIDEDNFQFEKTTVLSTISITNPKGFSWIGEGAVSKPVYMKGE